LKLTTTQRETVLIVALSQLGRNRTEGFKCIDFVRNVYASIGIIVPFPLIGWMSPLIGLNITLDQLSDPPEGELIFFRRKNDQRKRKWTHVGITLPEKRVVHCSQFLGEKVVVSDLTDLLEDYDFVL
jgi:cell wall-associated NlpC family hydrolase